MTSHSNLNPTADTIEIQDLRNKINKLSELISTLIFKDSKKAKFLLEELFALLEKQEDKGLYLAYYIQNANFYNQNYKYEESLSNFEKANVIFETEYHSDLKLQIEAYIDQSGVLINLEKFDDCEFLFSKIEQLQKVFPDEILVARLKTRMASFYLKQGNYDKAIDKFNRADIIFRTKTNLSIKDHYFLTIIQSGLGNIYEHNGDQNAAVNAYNQVVSICEQNEIHSRLSWHYLHAGLGCMSLEDYTQAKSYFEKSIKILDDSSMPARAGSYANLGYCYFMENDTKNALYFYETAEEIYKQINVEDYENLFYIQLWKSQVFSKLGEEEKESNHLLKAYDLAKKLGNNRILTEVYASIANYYGERKDFELAYKYQQMQIRFAEESFEEMKRQQITELQIKYDAEKKDQEAEMLKLESNRLQLKALRAQMNPHFIHNALNSIQHFINANEKETAAKYLAQFANLMRNSLYYSDLESISLEDEIEFLREYLDINKKLRYSDQMDFELKIDDDLEEDLIYLPSMIIQPYVENALEHGIRTRSDGKVSIRFNYHDEQTLQCIVEDNGIGRKMAEQIQNQGNYREKHRSMGTAITQKRLEVLKSSIKNKDLSVNIIDLTDDDGVATGTRVELMIPILEFKYK